MPANLENSAVATGLAKVSFSFQSQNRAVPKNVQITVQLPSFHMLVRLCSKTFKLGFNSTWTKNFQMYKLNLEKVEEPEIKLLASVGSQKKQENSRKTSASLTTLKSSTVWMTTNCGKFLKRWEYQTILPASWETCMQVKKQQNQTWNNGLVQNWERSISRLYVVTLLI